jgi:hypothetical protein
MAIINYQGHPELTLNLMRTEFCRSLFWPVWWYSSGRRDFGGPVAVAAVGLFTLPPVLAHAGLACTDVALAATMGAAFLILLVWAETQRGRQPGWEQLGDGRAFEFTSIGFLPAAAGSRALLHRHRAAGPEPAGAMARARAAIRGRWHRRVAGLGRLLVSFGKCPQGILPAPFSMEYSAILQPEWPPGFFCSDSSATGAGGITSR